MKMINWIGRKLYQFLWRVDIPDWEIYFSMFYGLPSTVPERYLMVADVGHWLTPLVTWWRVVILWSEWPICETTCMTGFLLVSQKVWTGFNHLDLIFGFEDGLYFPWDEFTVTCSRSSGFSCSTVVFKEFPQWREFAIQLGTISNRIEGSVWVQAMLS